jgi:hypothetical protein
LAAKHGDISLCRRLSYDVRISCYAVVAEETNNINLCEEAGRDKDDCYQKYAMNTQDASACDRITNVNYKDSCYQNLANTLSDPTLCERIRVVSYKDSCYQNMAYVFQDRTYCNSISNSDQKQNCLQNLPS